MTPHLARTQAVDAICDLLRAVAARKPPVVTTQDGLPRLLYAHLLGRNQEGRLGGAFRSQFGGSGGGGLWLGPEGIGGWRCVAVDKLG